MSKMKTRVIPAIVAAMALSMLAGCGGKDKAADAADAATTVAETTTQAEETTAEETKAEETEAKETEAEEAASSEENAAEAAAEVSSDGPVADYLEEVDSLNKGAEEFVTIMLEFMQVGQTEDTDAMLETVEKIRGTKQPFADFAVLENVPEGLEESHDRLAKAAASYADFMDLYCDVLTAGLNGEEHEATATIEQDMTNITTELSEAMIAVQEAAAALE